MTYVPMQLWARLILIAIGPLPISDVPVTHEIGWFCYQDQLTITDFKVETVGPTEFGLFGSGRSMVRVHIIGTLRSEGFRPYISKVQISEFFESPTAHASDMIADLVVTPVVDLDLKQQLGGQFFFDIKVEKTLKTYKWGPNVFKFRCGTFQREVVLHQSK